MPALLYHNGHVRHPRADDQIWRVGSSFRGCVGFDAVFSLLPSLSKRAGGVSEPPLSRPLVFPSLLVRVPVSGGSSAGVRGARRRSESWGSTQHGS